MLCIDRSLPFANGLGFEHVSTDFTAALRTGTCVSLSVSAMWSETEYGGPSAAVKFVLAQLQAVREWQGSIGCIFKRYRPNYSCNEPAMRPCFCLRAIQL